MPRFTSLIATLTATALVLPVAPAAAQSSSDQLIRDATAGSAAYPAATGSAMSAVLDALAALRLSNDPLPAHLVEDTPGYPFPTDPTIVEPAVVDRQVESDRLERWSVASPAMQRVVDVQIYRAADDTRPAPQLILLDGVSGRDDSGWVRENYVQEVFAEENATIIMPNDATGSMYTDWQEVDPALGRMQWETFLTEELAPVLAADEALNFNGRRGIGGLSMGAGAAVRIANLHPGLFDAVIGISGCYSTLDELGHQTTKMTVQSRGGSTGHMWGPFGTADWVRNDVVHNPAGLSEMAVYLSAGNGVIGNDDREIYATRPAEDMAKGVILERGALTCTQALEQSMVAAGMGHQVVDYTGSGAHNWSTYGAQLRPGWEVVKEALGEFSGPDPAAEES